MSGEFEWSGYASQPMSGVAESLDAAGIDCTMPQHGPIDEGMDCEEDDLRCICGCLRQLCVNPSTAATSPTDGARGQFR